ncbi:MAG: exopolyphosphatase [Aeromonadaceae bacterium]
MPNNVLAAIDLGSNSFHLVVARILDGRLQIIDKLKQRVRLAEGMDENKQLSEEAMQRGLDCLALFAERLSGINPDAVRITGTYTLRAAANAQLFLDRARALLHHPIDIISGQEEARLIYQGVAHTQHMEGRVLVIDIGGGSTELIIGEKFTPLALTSRKMGCVTFTKQFFANGKLSEKNFNAAILEGLHQLEPILTQYQGLGWQTCLGSSGTIKTVRELLVSQDENGIITLAQLERIKSLLIAQKRIEQLALPGLTEDRRPIVAAGVAVLIALFQGLGIERMEYSDGALREGLLYEFEQRLQHQDIRARSAFGIAELYHIDKQQAARVEATTQVLFDQVAAAWQLEPEIYRPLLCWAAMLHETGLAINYTAIQRHSAYILENSDLPGFNLEEQSCLATFVRFHRKAIRRQEFTPIPNYPDAAIWRCIRILRLAVALHHRRLDHLLPPLTLKAEGDHCSLSLPAQWCEANRLLMQNLEREQGYLQAQGWQLELIQAV